MKNKVIIGTEPVTGRVHLFRTQTQAAERLGCSHQGVQQALAYGRTILGWSFRMGDRFFAVRLNCGDCIVCRRVGESYVRTGSGAKVERQQIAAVRDVTFSMWCDTEGLV